MDLLKILIASLLIFLFSCTEKEKKETSKAAISVKDDLGIVINFEKIPEKAVSLAPSLTEIIFDLEEENRLAGNTLYCDYPEKAKKIKKVGDLLNADFEAILQINPDIIFVTIEGNSKDNYDKLIKLGFKVFVSNPRNFEGIKKSYTDIAEIFGKKDFALRKIKIWNGVIDSIKKGNSEKTKKNALFLISLKPLFAAGNNTFINEMLNICNLNNLAEKTLQNYPVLNIESVLTGNPDVILLPDYDYNKEAISKIYPQLAGVNAVKTKSIFLLDQNLFSRPGPRFYLAVKEMNRIISDLK
ncbi:MAG: ABC transporter substrate-binding protein [Ignavibacteria bacterium]|nr:ABC transporter substrate-binding protein [Ignavibacteria bacterium]